MSGAPGLAARRSATQLLAGVLNDRRMLSDLIEAETGPLAGLEGPERARAGTLATLVLRHLDRLDTLLAHFMDRPPPAPVLNALRLAAAEILEDRIPSHAAVNAAVMLVAGQRKHRHLKGLANAVARRVAAEGPGIWATLPPAQLPKWLRGTVARNWGPDVRDRIEAVHGRTPPLDITPRDPATAGDLAAQLSGGLVAGGSIRVHMPGQVSLLPGYADGAWWVQDAAAALPVQLLGDVAGLRILDLCAAPGGKTMQLCAAGARVTALDISQGRLERLRENLDRTGLGADIVVADACDWTPDAPFDAIVLDAPCSASGTLRRHPDLPHVRPDPDLRPLLELQARLIDLALGWVKPSGRLLYCTCSLLPREGEDQVGSALARHPGLTRAPLRPAQWDPDWWTGDGDLRLRPDFLADKGGMDGFFATVLQKPPPAS